MLLRNLCLSVGFLLSALPLAAQTVWGPSSNPHIVRGTVTIPTGQTLTLQPGTVVQIQANSSLKVDGKLLGQGIASNHIRITGADNYSASLSGGGTIQLNYSDLSAKISPPNASLLLSNCTFSGNGSITAINGNAPQYMQLDHCTFIGNGTPLSSSLYVDHSTVVLHDVAFNAGAWLSILYAYVYLDNVRSDHAAYNALSFLLDAPLYLNNVSVTNAGGAALTLGGGNWGVNSFLGSNITLQGNQYPIALVNGGLTPDSVVPASGNISNTIFAPSGDFLGPALWPNLGVPYLVENGNLNLTRGLWTISAGTAVQMMPSALLVDHDGGLRVFGTPDAPVRFVRQNPAQSWYGIHTEVHTGTGRMNYAVIEGSDQGVNGGTMTLENSIFRNNNFGTQGDMVVRGSQYLNNTVGVAPGKDGNLNGGISMPNLFEGNGVAAQNPSGYSVDARNNWWGAPSGPRTSSNPGGTGDPLDDFNLPYNPFLTTRPDLTNAAPIVHLNMPFSQALPGTKQTLTWTAQDDSGVTQHIILFSPSGHFESSFQTVAVLPGSQKTFEWTVPTIGFQAGGTPAYLRVVAVDAMGKTGYDEAELLIPSGRATMDLTLTAPQSGAVYPPGQFFPINWTVTNPGELYDGGQSSIVGYLVLESAEPLFIPLGAIISLQQTPYVSTDTARVMLIEQGNLNDVRVFYSPFFKIRPDARIGDAPPQITLNSPSARQNFTAGSIVPISWSAIDDEGIRGFDILASYDSGRTWQPIAKDLPGNTTVFNWQTASGSGYPDVRVMVIARDVRFQTSSAGQNTAFSLQPSRVVSGVIHLQSAVNNAQAVTMVFRPTDGSANFSRTVILGSDGAFRLADIPSGRFNLAIKGSKWLQNVVVADVTNGDITHVDATLLAGDANNDNRVDIQDLLLLIAHYNAQSANPNYLSAADFNGDGKNDITDLLLLIANYNAVGDP